MSRRFREQLFKPANESHPDTAFFGFLAPVIILIAPLPRNLSLRRWTVEHDKRTLTLNARSKFGAERKPESNVSHAIGGASATGLIRRNRGTALGSDEHAAA